MTTTMSSSGDENRRDVRSHARTELNAGSFAGVQGRKRTTRGIWDHWKDASGSAAETCSILTTTPNAVTALVHDRMPVILDLDSHDLWLDPGMKSGLVSDLLKPFNAGIKRSCPVSSRVNQVVNDNEECSAPVQPVPTQSQLLF
jgi:putative SOS response-associated peptidase YedK